MKRNQSEINQLSAAEFKKEKEQMYLLEKENASLVEEMKEKMALLEECQKRKAQPLSYEDLYNGGLLSKKVSAFTLLIPFN